MPGRGVEPERDPHNPQAEERDVIEREAGPPSVRNFFHFQSPSLRFNTNPTTSPIITTRTATA